MAMGFDSILFEGAIARSELRTQYLFGVFFHFLKMLHFFVIRKYLYVFCIFIQTFSSEFQPFLLGIST